eukprot:scaffold1328_cov162-Amphora_coffeaeformis.AAC.34
MLSSQTSRLVSRTLRKASQASKRQLRTGTGTGRSSLGSAWRPADGSHLLSRWNTATSVRCLGTTTNSGITTRSKSSVAYAEDDDYEFTGSVSLVEKYPSQGHPAAEAVAKSYVEAWMINIGRNNDNAWLTGDREDKWWTGIHPRQCPGTYFVAVVAILCVRRRLVSYPRLCVLLYAGADEAGIIRSLPLPNLSCVTRQAAKEYFDNSWTLYETLFAGLKGEEGFYRYVERLGEHARDDPS